MGLEGSAPTLADLRTLTQDRPHAWLTDVLGRIAEHDINRIDELLPWHYIGNEGLEFFLQSTRRRSAARRRYPSSAYRRTFRARQPPNDAEEPQMAPYRLELVTIVCRGTSPALEPSPDPQITERVSSEPFQKVMFGPFSRHLPCDWCRPGSRCLVECRKICRLAEQCLLRSISL